MNSEPILKTESLDVRYGPFRALFDVSVDISEGETLAVLGANGAGKSTLGRAMSGLVPVTSGRILFAGRDITKWSARRRRRAGLAYIPEGRAIFPGLSVTDNLRMAVSGLEGDKSQRREAIERAEEMFPILGQRRHQRAGSLSGGEQQMLALGRVLTTNPKVIIADEMSLGLAPLVVATVFEGLERAREMGIAIVMIEQFVHRALAMANRCVIFSRGSVSWSGPASAAGDEVLDRYLGAGAEAAAKSAAGSTSVDGGQVREVSGACQ
jgi:branched-chain amino acid transport system ATP-binding protein